MNKKQRAKIVATAARYAGKAVAAVVAPLAVNAALWLTEATGVEVVLTEDPLRTQVAAVVTALVVYLVPNGERPTRDREPEGTDDT